MKRSINLLLLMICATISFAQTKLFNGPVGSGKFGYKVYVLTNGNYVVIDPFWDNGSIVDAGAVYLFNGRTFALISTLTGSTANDQVGYDGIVELNNSNYAVCSRFWNNGTAKSAGAITWCNGTTGLNGIVSVANSLTGGKTDDFVGAAAGNVYKLHNGNYVVRSPNWDNGSIVNAGAVTWCDGTALTTGVISSANSLVGSHTGDVIGSYKIEALNNGNYVVISPYWSTNTVSQVGAVTWCDGSIGRTGLISAANSIVGSQNSDWAGNGGILQLSNGNYVIKTRYWQNGSMASAGAVTWCDGTTGRTGVISATNSMIGNSAYEMIGSGGVVALTNGNYVIGTPDWDNGSLSDVGAATWCNGTTGRIGIISAANSLTGSQAGDAVGFVDELTNGNYVVCSKNWDNGTIVNAGAVTLCNGFTGRTGIVSVSNSLTGGKTNDRVGAAGATALSNGHYVVGSPYWSDGTATSVGAVTWCSGVSGLIETVSATNSLVGSQNNDQVGIDIYPLNNGNYVVCSNNWDNGSITDAGAVTLCNGTTGMNGSVSDANSMVGSHPADRIGSEIVTLTNGNFVVRNFLWDNGSLVDAGAATWCSSTSGLTGPISSANSLVGSSAQDKVGSAGIRALSNGGYTVNSTGWDNGSIQNGGAISYGNGVTGVTGEINACNSVMGIVPISDGIVFTGADLVSAYNAVYNYLVVGKPYENAFAIYRQAGHGISNDNDQVTQTVNNSAIILGTTNCTAILMLTPKGNSPVGGQVTATSHVQSNAFFFNSKAYARRSYDITPANNASTATGRVTLYFAQSDFTDYNDNNGTAGDLPATPTDATGIANLRILQQHGTSASGNIGTYNGADVTINPADSDIVWNSSEDRWEISFDVTGFSGFFAFGAPSSPLPVALISFYAAAEEQRNKLNWEAISDQSLTNFEVERSATADQFKYMATIAGRQGVHGYVFYDTAPITPVTYYRLKSVSTNGKVAYSQVVAVHRNNTIDNSVTIFPVPVSRSLTIVNARPELNGTGATIYSIDGREMYRFTMASIQEVDVYNWPGGIYFLRLANGTCMRVDKR